MGGGVSNAEDTQIHRSREPWTKGDIRGLQRMTKERFDAPTIISPSFLRYRRSPNPLAALSVPALSKVSPVEKGGESIGFNPPWNALAAVTSCSPAARVSLRSHTYLDTRVIASRVEILVAAGRRAGIGGGRRRRKRTEGGGLGNERSTSDQTS